MSELVSHRSLRVLAALAWLSGGVVLLLKGTSLLLEALAQQPGDFLPWLAGGAGILIGVLKMKFLFNGFCRRNLDRIAALEQPKIWQFFRPGFMVFLAAMIVFGATLSRLALDNYPLLIGVIVLDFSLATALLGSSLVFRKIYS